LMLLVAGMSRLSWQHRWFMRLRPLSARIWMRYSVGARVSFVISLGCVDGWIIRIVGNRGANGIDGVVSSALGVSAGARLRQVEKAPTVLVIGDLSFFHDLNGLLAARLHQLDLTIILINNDGGGIFSFLSQAAYSEHFEQLFGTPTGLDFQPVVQMYGGTYCLATDWTVFRQAFQQSIHDRGLHVIELRTERTSNVAMHRQLWQGVEDALDQVEEKHS
jgi:2-succinyl-5-enolpyruvyl-6-hydroxy-3-cyclohexene-1-carboxylate synthase